MRVNCEKTQLLCVSSNVINSVKSYIRYKGSEIRSTDKLKILGFTFGSKPNVQAHVDALVYKFRSRLWALRHLRRSGMCQADLLFVYLSVLRPVLDFAVPAYHSLLTQTQSDKLEGLQCRALKIVYNCDLSYNAALTKSSITTLSERRRILVENFAIKASKNPRFADGWFPLRTNNKYDTRNQKKYIEFPATTERLRNSPLHYMRRVLNGL